MDAVRVRRVSAHRIGIELGWTRNQLRASLQRDTAVWLRYMRGRLANAALYDAELIEVLRAVRGQEHREVVATGDDWLTRYQEGRA